MWRIDRLGRLITDLIKLVSALSDRGIQFRSMTEAIDTATPGGELAFDFAALAQMERRLLAGTNPSWTRIRQGPGPCRRAADRDDSRETRSRPRHARQRRNLHRNLDCAWYRPRHCPQSTGETNLTHVFGREYHGDRNR